MPLKASSPYRDTPQRDFYLDLWNPVKITPSPDDRTVTIPPAFDRRPDKMAYELFGSPNYWWVFSVRNPDILVDPVEDFRAGVDIIVPPTQKITGV